jgi:hypothetical protein
VRVDASSVATLRKGALVTGDHLQASRLDTLPSATPSQPGLPQGLQARRHVHSYTPFWLE